MDLLLTISDLRSGATHPVVLTAPPGATLGEIEPLLTQFVDRQACWQIGGRRLLSDEILVDAGVCDGAVLEATDSIVGNLIGAVPEAAEQSSGPIAHLQVVSGPDAGTTWTLRQGTYIIGRSRSSDLILPSDELVSRQHARLQITPDGVILQDMTSSNGTLISGVNASVPTPVGPGEVVELGDSILSLSVVSGAGAPTVPNVDGSKAFNRQPRIISRFEPGRLSVPMPPGERQDVTLSIVGIVLPLLIGVVMALLVKPIFILFALLSPVMALSTYVTNRRKGAKSHRSAVSGYQERKVRYSEDLKGVVDHETAILRAASPDPVEVASTACAPLTRLWERRRTDPDFLSIRIGVADRPSSIELIGGARPDDPNSLSVEQPVLNGIPVTVNLPSVGVLGVAGGAPQVTGLASWLVAQVATLQAPDDVQLVILGDDDSVPSWVWAMWLPHVRVSRDSNTATLGFGLEAMAHLANQVAATVESRIQVRDSTRIAGPPTLESTIVVVIGTSYQLKDIPGIETILRLGPSVGVLSICLADTAQQLPEECRALVTVPLGADAPLELRIPNGSPITGILADKVTAGWAEEVARALAPFRLNRRPESTGGLPESLVLLDLLGLEPPTGSAVASIWATGGRSTSAAIGAEATGRLVVDLRSDGPHGLVAGTTGSGKSELLQTLIASLAVNNRPDALNFVLVDYKGGSAFSACAHLPHTVGMVTDLDGHLTERALTSLSAEVRRRERLFREVGAKDIDDYWRIVDRNGATASTPMIARILIVIDEFASLVEEVPEFVDGLVDLARRGRSFGIHLILATQRPAGVVSPAIKTNTNLRIAMRVTDAMDSADVIDSPLASRIPKSSPGRGYVRVGHEQLVEFQAARVGGRRRDPSHSQVRPELRMLSAQTLAFAPPRQVEIESDDDLTDLSVLVEAVVTASDSLGITPPESPWLPPLPNQLLLTDLENSELDASARGLVPFGREDHPAERTRTVVSLDLEHGGHLLVAGDPGSGRTTLLRTIAASASKRFGPQDLHMYAVDCGNGALLPLAELPQCGAVVSRPEIERTDRLLAMLSAEVAHRQRVISSGGFSSLADQRASAPPDQRLPYLLILLDRWEGFTAAFEGIDGGRMVSAVQHLLQEGAGAGVQVVLTGDRSVLVGRMATSTEFRLVLRLNDRSSYALAGLNPRKLPDEIPAGRAFRADSGREVQIGLLGPDSTGTSQVAELREIALRCRHQASDFPVSHLPEPIAVLPSHLSVSSIDGESGWTPTGPLTAAIGVGGNRLERAILDLLADGPGFVVAGPRRSGRSNALLTMAHSFTSTGATVIGVVTLPSPLEAIEGASGVAGILTARTSSTQDLDMLVASVGGPLVVLVDDVEQLVDAPLGSALEQLLRNGRDHQRSVVIAGSTAELNSVSFRGLVAEARKSRAGLLLSPGAPGDAELFGVRLPKTALFTGPPGRAVQIAGGEHRIIQMANMETNSGDSPLTHQ